MVSTILRFRADDQERTIRSLFDEKIFFSKLFREERNATDSAQEGQTQVAHS